MARGTRHGRRPVGKRWRWARRLVLVLLIAALIGTAYYLIGFAQSSDEFDLSTVRLEGLNVLTDDEVLEASGVSSGDSVLQLDRAKIEAGIVTLPYVESAEVTIVFPDTMIVRVVERVPVATLIVRNAAFELDADCVVLRRYRDGEALMPPLVTNVGGLDVVEVGDVIDVQALHDALDAWNALKETAVGQALTLSEIAAKSPDEILMYFDEIPYEIRWGRGGIEAQARRLALLWDERDGNLGCAEYLDLRFGEDIVCK